jgi:hypothetical protein
MVLTFAKQMANNHKPICKNVSVNDLYKVYIFFGTHQNQRKSSVLNFIKQQTLYGYGK